jgi:S1-C subfamily serine protease
MVVYTAAALQSSYLLTTQALLHVRDGIRSQGKVSHGYVGIMIAPLECVGEPPKIIISEVALASPAAEAGLRCGDELLTVNGRPIHEMADVRQAAFFVHPGQFVPIEIRRDNKVKTLTVHVAPLPSSMTEGLGTEP